MLRHVFAHPEIDCTMPAMNSMDELYCNLQAAYNPALSSPEEKPSFPLELCCGRDQRAHTSRRIMHGLENWSRKKHV